MSYLLEKYISIWKSFLFSLFFFFTSSAKNNTERSNAIIFTSPETEFYWVISIILFLLAGIIILALNYRRTIRAEEALKMNERRLNLALNATNDGIWDWNILTDEVYFSPRWLQILGYSQKKSNGNMVTWQKFIHCDDRDYVIAALEAHLRGETPGYETEYRMSTAHEEWRWILDRGKIVEWDNSGKPMRMTGTQQDITQRKHFEVQIQESERKFRELSDMLPQTIFEADFNGYLTFANRIAFEQFGFEKDEPISGLNVFNFVIPEDHSRARLNFSRALRNEKFVEEYTAVRKDGSLFPVLIHSAPIYRNHSIIGLRGLIIDISERKKNEEAIVESEAKYRTLIETQAEGVILTDTNAIITFCNPSANTIFGFSDDSLVGKNLKDFTSEDQLKKLELYSNQMLTGIKSVFELEIIRKDRIVGWIQITITPYRNTSGKIIGGFAVFTDITGRKKSESDLIKAKEDAERSNKLKTEFLAQVSHEIRTPINSILSFTSLLKDELEDRIPEDLRSSFRIIENGGRRLIRTIDLILNMSQIQTGTYDGNMVLLDLEKDVLDGVILEFLPALRERKLEFHYCNDGVENKIFADQYTVIQIFMNLLDNAIKYTPSGRIDIVMRFLNPEILIQISDTGIGISKEYLPHLFTAFSQEESGYTRRFDGNGLGLALVKKYCELNNARIEVESEKDQGSIFSVFFKAANNKN